MQFLHQDYQSFSDVIYTILPALNCRTCIFFGGIGVGAHKAATLLLEPCPQSIGSSIIVTVYLVRKWLTPHCDAPPHQWPKEWGHMILD
jgi:hypothetical protein